MTLDSVLALFLQGASAETIVDEFDTLALADVYATIAYYLRHRTEVDAYLVERRREAERVRSEYERRFPPDDLWDRLGRRGAEHART